MAGLFNALVFNNGTAHTFVDRGQIPNAKAIERQYIEPAAPASAECKLTVKHDMSSKSVKRSLLQHTIKVAGSDGVLYPITVNLSAAYNPKHAAADVTAAIKMVKAAAADTTFDANFVLGLS